MAPRWFLRFSLLFLLLTALTSFGQAKFEPFYAPSVVVPERGPEIVPEVTQKDLKIAPIVVKISRVTSTEGVALPTEVTTVPEVTRSVQEAARAIRTGRITVPTEITTVPPQDVTAVPPPEITILPPKAKPSGANG